MQFSSAGSLAVLATLLKTSFTGGRPADHPTRLPPLAEQLPCLEVAREMVPLRTRTKAEQEGLTESSKLPGSGKCRSVCIHEADGPHRMISLALSCRRKLICHFIIFSFVYREEKRCDFVIFGKSNL